MGEGFQFFDIIILAVIAGFLVLKLRSTLGRRSGHQPPRSQDPFRKGPAEDGDEKVIKLPDRGLPERDDEESAEPFATPEAGAPAGATPLAAGLTQIKLADRGFDEADFATGAQAAFEMVIAAFGKGETKTLRPLLSNDVYDDFAGAIKAREDAKEALETTLVGVKEAEIIEAELQGKTAFVTVKFVSEQINVTHNASGEVVDGDSNHVATITDIWTFARNTRSRDPNWTLVATRSSN